MARLYIVSLLIYLICGAHHEKGETLGWRKHRLESRLLGEISITSDIQTAAAAAAKSLQSCPTLCDPIDGSPPGSTVPGILQAGTLGVGCHFLLHA